MAPDSSSPESHVRIMEVMVVRIEMLEWGRSCCCRVTNDETGSRHCRKLFLQPQPSLRIVLCSLDAEQSACIFRDVCFRSSCVTDIRLHLHNPSSEARLSGFRACAAALRPHISRAHLCCKSCTYQDLCQVHTGILAVDTTCRASRRSFLAFVTR